jgi:hypothetical protein
MQSSAVGQSARNEGFRRAPLSSLRSALAASVATLRRQGDAISADVARVRRLPGLVARATSARAWSEADRREADDVARSLVRVGAWCVILVVPGGLLLLPLLFASDRAQS